MTLKDGSGGSEKPAIYPRLKMSVGGLGRNGWLQYSSSNVLVPERVSAIQAGQSRDPGSGFRINIKKKRI